MTTWNELIDGAEQADVFAHAEWSGLGIYAPALIDPESVVDWPGFYVVQGQNEGWLLYGIEHRTDRTALIAKFLGPIDEALAAAQALTRMAYAGPTVYARHMILPGA
jgi:hypothetical protein